MAYKALTNKGIKFIRAVSSGEGTSLIKGSNNYKLKNSGQEKNTTYEAKAMDHNGDPITTNSQLGEALIIWFNHYSEEYDLDANIIAAQAYQESKYKIWNFSKTGAQGISQFLSSSLYDVAIGQLSFVSNVLPEFTNEEIDKLTVGLESSNRQNSYIYKSSNPNLATAIKNRLPFFQNIINNPELLIKAQCRLMSALNDKSANIAASCLFGYNRGMSYVKKTYIQTVSAGKRGKTNLDEGLEYVKQIFIILGNGVEINGRKLSFGYDKIIDYEYDTFAADVKSTNNELSNINGADVLSTPSNYTIAELTTTDTGILNLPTLSEIGKLKLLATEVLEKINKRILGGKRLIVNSSFRSDLVNADVGGVKSSQHKSAEATDFRADGFDMTDVFNKIYNDPEIIYDQLIYEKKGNAVTDIWIHVSYKKPDVDNLPTPNDSETLSTIFIKNRAKYNELIAPNRRETKSAIFINGKPKYSTYNGDIGSIR